MIWQDRLGKLYKLRIIADYVSSDSISPAKLSQAGRDARHLVKVFISILGGE